MKVEINAKDIEALRKRMKDMNNVLTNTKTPISRIAVVLYQSVMKNFSEEGTDKEHWKALSATTLMMRRKGGGSRSAKILQDTGFMKASIMPEVVSDKIAQVGLTGKEQDIGRIHQFGLNNIPKRPFMILRTEYKERIYNICRQWFFNGKAVNE